MHIQKSRKNIPQQPLNRLNLERLHEDNFSDKAIFVSSRMSGCFRQLFFQIVFRNFISLPIPFTCKWFHANHIYFWLSKSLCFLSLWQFCKFSINFQFLLAVFAVFTSFAVVYSQWYTCSVINKKFCSGILAVSLTKSQLSFLKTNDWNYLMLWVDT